MGKLLLVLLSTIILLTGCSGTPTSEQLASADYGRYPKNYEKVIKDYMQSQLKDPDSATYKFRNIPKSGWSSLGKTLFGYRLCVEINAKNSYGGYVGSRMSYFMIKNDVVIDSHHTTSGSYGGVFVNGFCKDLI